MQYYGKRGISNCGGRRQWLRRRRAASPARRPSDARAGDRWWPAATPAGCSARSTRSSRRLPTGRCSTPRRRSLPTAEVVFLALPHGASASWWSRARAPTPSSSTSAPTSGWRDPAAWAALVRRRPRRDLAVRAARAAGRPRRDRRAHAGSRTPAATPPRSRSASRRCWRAALVEPGDIVVVAGERHDAGRVGSRRSTCSAAR